MESLFGVSWFAHSLQPAELLASLADLTRHCLPSQRRLLLPSFRTSRSPFSPSDITTVASGHLHRQDSHLLEPQLASLHEQRRFEPPVLFVIYGACEDSNLSGAAALKPIKESLSKRTVG